MKRLLSLLLICLILPTATAESWVVSYCKPDDYYSREYLVSDDGRILATPDQYSEIDKVAPNLYAVSPQYLLTEEEVRHLSHDPLTEEDYSGRYGPDFHPMAGYGEGDERSGFYVPMALMNGEGQLLTGYDYFFHDYIPDEDAGLLQFTSKAGAGIMRADGTVLIFGPYDGGIVPDGRGGFLAFHVADEGGKGRLVHIDADGTETALVYPLDELDIQYYSIYEYSIVDDCVIVKGYVRGEDGEDGKYQYALLNLLGQPLVDACLDSAALPAEGYARGEAEGRVWYVDRNGVSPIDTPCEYIERLGGTRFVGLRRAGSDVIALCRDTATGATLEVTACTGVAEDSSVQATPIGEDLFAVSIVSASGEALSCRIFDWNTGTPTGTLPDGYRVVRALDDGGKADARRLVAVSGAGDARLEYLADLQGNVLSAGFHEIEPFSDRYCAATSIINTGYDREFTGFIDMDGETCVEPVFTFISGVGSNLHEGHTEDYSVYLFNDDLELVLDSPIDNAEQLNAQRCIIETEDNSFGLIDLSGNWIMEPVYSRISMQLRYYDRLLSKEIYFEDRIIVVTQDGLTGVVDDNGNWIMEPAYDDVEILYSNLFMVEKDGRIGLMKDDGSWPIAPLLRRQRNINMDGYSTPGHRLSEDRYWFVTENRTGMIDSDGNWLLMMDEYNQLMD